MEKFTYMIDQKYTIWQRSEYCIEAESQEEADKQILYAHREFAYDEDHGFVENDILYGTERIIAPSDNEGYATMEVRREDGDSVIVFKNGK